jgi:flagellar basal-body rod protein FlgG
MAVQGVGYFQLQKPDGSEIYYSRDGSFRLDNQGRLVNLDGYLVMPNITVPPNATGTLKVNPNGTITMLNADLNNEVELGYIQIVSFPNENGLLPQGKNLYAASSTSGLPTMGNPGTLGLGALTQGFLEMSNVKPIEEMVALIATQRAYEQATRVMEAANQMLGQTSNIRT